MPLPFLGGERDGSGGWIVWPKKVRSVKREMEQGDEQFDRETGAQAALFRAFR
jgi:hypothetical protein